MSRELIFSWNGQCAIFDFRRIERRQLYGSKRRIAVDERGTPCTRASMTLDGNTVLRPGMTAQGWFTDEGEQVETSDLIAVGTDGQPLPMHPSTLGVAQPLTETVEPSAVLDLAVEAVLALAPQSLPDGLRKALQDGKVFRFTYCYRPEAVPPTAFLMGNAEGFFALVGRPTACQWMSREQAAHDVDGGTDDDDLDFEMV